MSKKIFLRRKEVMNHLPKEVRAEATVKLSSVYVNRQPLKAFDPKEEAKYLNGILDVAPDHQDWPKHSKTYWAEMSIPVGFTGVELEIGTDDDDNPLQIIDFIKYRFAIKHPHVALTKEEADGNSMKRFYIWDTKRDDVVKNKDIQLKKDASRVFIKLSDDLKSMRRVLRIMSDVNPDLLSREQVENALYSYMEKTPAKFIKIATDSNLGVKAEIEEMVSAGVLRKIGNQIIFIDEVIGETMENAVVYLKNKKNSGTLTILRAKLKEIAI